MTQRKRAGASRPSRRLVLNLAAFAAIAIALLLTIGRGNAERKRGATSVGTDEFDRTDVENATHLLASVSGANGVVCAAVDRSFDTGYWGRMHSFMQPDIQASSDDIETAQWIGKRKLDHGVVGVARPALSGDDACVRRVAIRLLGSVESPRLHEELRSELESAVTAIKVAAILALGYAEQTESVARLRELTRDSDRAIRVAAIWGLGRLEDSTSMELLIGLLKNDQDPEVRRAAAWALGQFDD